MITERKIYGEIETCTVNIHHEQYYDTIIINEQYGVVHRSWLFVKI